MLIKVTDVPMSSWGEQTVTEEAQHLCDRFGIVVEIIPLLHVEADWPLISATGTPGRIMNMLRYVSGADVTESGSELVYHILRDAVEADSGTDWASLAQETPNLFAPRG